MFVKFFKTFLKPFLNIDAGLFVMFFYTNFTLNPFENFSFPSMDPAPYTMHEVKYIFNIFQKLLYPFVLNGIPLIVLTNYAPEVVQTVFVLSPFCLKPFALLEYFLTTGKYFFCNNPILKTLCV